MSIHRHFNHFLPLHAHIVCIRFHFHVLVYRTVLKDEVLKSLNW